MFATATRKGLTNLEFSKMAPLKPFVSRRKRGQLLNTGNLNVMNILFVTEYCTNPHGIRSDGFHGCSNKRHFS